MSAGFDPLRSSAGLTQETANQRLLSWLAYAQWWLYWVLLSLGPINRLTSD
jgi:hypothetical protein